MDINVSKTVLLIIDVQNDFCPAYKNASGLVHSDGALAVKEGCEVVAPLNALAKAITLRGGRAAATQDWHPNNHVSFASSYKNKNPGDTVDTELVKAQILWPNHCVQGTAGAAFHDDLDMTSVSLILRKGFRVDLDSYSAFYENDRVTATGLEGWINSLNIDTVIMGGLATDYCVYHSAMDCKKLGYKTIIASDAVRGVGSPEGSLEKALTMMRASGIDFITSANILDNLRKW